MRSPTVSTTPIFLPISFLDPSYRPGCEVRSSRRQPTIVRLQSASRLLILVLTEIKGGNQRCPDTTTSRTENSSAYAAISLMRPPTLTATRTLFPSAWSSLRRRSNCEAAQPMLVSTIESSNAIYNPKKGSTTQRTCKREPRHLAIDAAQVTTIRVRAVPSNSASTPTRPHECISVPPCRIRLRSSAEINATTEPVSTDSAVAHDLNFRPKTL